MIDVRDKIVEYPHRYKLTQVAEDTYDLERVEGTITDSGTVVGRNLLMAMQGFLGQVTEFNPDGSILETNSKGETMLTEFNQDGSITETFTADGISIAKQIIFNLDGSISEVVL